MPTRQHCWVAGLAKAALEGFNITYRELNEQQENETNKRIQLEAEIATDEAAIEQKKDDFIEKSFLKMFEGTSLYDKLKNPQLLVVQDDCECCS